MALRFVEAIKSLFGGSQEDPKSRFVESAGVDVDSDLEGWRRLTGNAKRDLSPMTQLRMQELALYSWRTNPLANRLIELPIAFLLAEGVTLQVDDEEAQGWLTAFWRDPINRMDIKLTKKVRELALYGEQCYPAFVAPNGHVRLGYLDPGLIETVVTDPDNIEQPIGIVTRKGKENDFKGRRYKVIINGPETVFTDRTQAIRESFEDGECFYFAVNDLSNMTRGTSDLLANLDWLDAYEHALFGEIERWDFLRAFIYDVTLSGATPDEVKERAKHISVPKPGSVRVHNDSEEWKAEAPSLGSYESANNARLFRNHILGGASLPEHWFGGGGDVNRATASEMGEPTVKMLTMRQAMIGYMLEEIGTYQIRQRLRAYYGAEPEQSNHPDDYIVSARFPELSTRDVAKTTAALAQTVTAAAVAVERGLLSEQTAVELVAISAAQMGHEMDPVEELAAARADLARRREEDSFGLDPTLPDSSGPGGMDGDDEP